jgi:hypothetical protein
VADRNGRVSVKVLAVKVGAVEAVITDMAESNRKARMEDIDWPPARLLRVTLAVLLLV